MRIWNFGHSAFFFENNFVYLDREETITELMMFWNKRKTENLPDTLFTKYEKVRFFITIIIIYYYYYYYYCYYFSFLSV